MLMCVSGIATIYALIECAIVDAVFGRTERAKPSAGTEKKKAQARESEADEEARCIRANDSTAQGLHDKLPLECILISTE